MRLIAITGPMGSGKSTVAAYIASRGFDVYDCDRIFNTGVINSPDYVAEIERLFGAVKGGKVDKKALSAHLAAHPEDVIKLNAAAHPRVVAKLLELTRGKDVAFAEVQVPDALDGVEHELWLVTAPAAVRAKRVAARDGRGEEEIAALNASNLLRDTNSPPFPMTDGSSDSIRRSSPVDERLMTSPRGELLSSAMRHAAREPAVMTISA